MMLRSSLGALVVLGGMTMAGVSHAQEEPVAMKAAAGVELPASSAKVSSGHARGLMVQARLQSQSSLLSLGGGPGFLVGYQGPSYALGLGLGLTRIGVNANGDSATLTLFQAAPTAIIDVWHSADGRARANLIGSVGYARASLAATLKTKDCQPNVNGGETCTTSTRDGEVKASLIPVMLGFGGDYYLSRNFALGAEFGVQALFLAGANASSGSDSKSVDVGANGQFAYGALRATFVLGD